MKFTLDYFVNSHSWNSSQLVVELLLFSLACFDAIWGEVKQRLVGEGGKKSENMHTSCWLYLPRSISDKRVKTLVDMDCSKFPSELGDLASLILQPHLQLWATS